MCIRDRLCISALAWEALAYLALSKKIVLDLTPCGECENDLCAEPVSYTHLVWSSGRFGPKSVTQARMLPMTLVSSPLERA